MQINAEYDFFQVIFVNICIYENVIHAALIYIVNNILSPMLMCYFDNKMSHSIVQPSILQCTLLNHDYVNNKNTVVLSTHVSSACTTIMHMHGNLGFINAEQLC